MDLRDYRLSLDAILAEFARLIMSMLLGYDVRDTEAQKTLSKNLLPVVREYRLHAAEATNRFMQAQAEKFGAQAFTPNAEGYGGFALQNALREARSPEELTSTLQRHIEASARRQIVRSVPSTGEESSFTEPIDFGDSIPVSEISDSDDEKPIIYPVGWARVLSGAENCAFCIMLASRGPVYTSASHAGTVSKTIKRQLLDRSERKRNRTVKVYARERYHNNCDCTVVPVYDKKADWEGKKQYELLAAEWKRMRNQSKSPGTSLKEWEDWIKENPLEIPKIREIENAA